ncbi:Calx-beta domain-containing protein [Urbifossiella limnaea]|nr:Calx-beta domain-containing protein [Urbifossiella limnaea]
MRPLRTRKRLAVERLEDRTNPGAHPVATAAAAGYRVGDQIITLDTRADELVVGLPGGTAALAPLVATGGPLVGLTAARWLTPELVVLAGPADYAAKAAAIPGVTFTAPVYQNPDTGGWLVATNEVIVALAPGADPSALADPRFASWEPLPGTPDQFVVKAAAGYGPVALSLAEALHGDPRFTWAEPNFYQDFQKHFTPNDTLYASEWHLNNTGQVAGQTAGADVDAELAWDVTKGSQNVVVAVVDDGMDITHPDLAPNVFINQGEIPAAVRAALTDVDGDGIISFVDLNNAANVGAGKAVDVNGNGRIDPNDILSPTASGGWADGADGSDGNGYVDDLCGWDFTTNGTTGDLNPGADVAGDKHATSVAGVAVGVGNNNLGTTGIAFQSRILPVRIFSGNTITSDANVAAAIYYAAGRTRDGLGTFRSGDVLNNSWGGGSPVAAITAAFTWASNTAKAGKGVPTFVSSGDDFASAVSYPASLAGSLPGVIAVGASTDVETRAAYSNYGPELDFVAPSDGPNFGGVSGIVTTDRQGTSGYNTAAGLTGDYTTTFGGTSSASPLAAGIGALVLAVDPTLTAAQVRTLMRATTELIGPNVNAAGFAVGFGYGRVNANAAVRGVGVAEVQVLDDRADVPDGTGSVSLGGVPVGGVGATRTFRVRNQGTLPLTLGAVSVTGPFEVVSGLGSSTLTTGQYTTFTLRFLPTASGAATGTVTFTSNDLNEGTFDFTVSGTGLTPSLAGRVYEDWAGNGTADANDPGVAGRQVFLDLNGNGTYDATPTAVVFNSGAVNVAIPDATGAVATSTQAVSAAGLVTKATVRVSIAHTYVSDLAIELVGPGGQSVMLFSGRGAAGTNLTNTVFDDAAANPIASGSSPFTATFRPEESLAAFIGTAAGGAWTLRVRDSAAADTGTISNWTLTLTVAEPTQTTTAAGTFAFAGLPAGTYAVRTVVPGGWTVTGPAGGSYSQALSAGGSVTGLNFGAVRQNAVYGQMANDLNGNGVRDAGEPTLAGWRVFDDRNGNGTLDGGEVNALTDALGNYLLPGLAAGATTIRVERQAGYFTTIGTAGLPLTMVAGSTYHGRDFGAVFDPVVPTADIIDVTPDPRTSPVPSVAVVFSEAVTGFDLADLSLTRDGGANLLTAAQTLTTTDNVTWTLGNLAGLTAAPGTYVLTLTAAGSGVEDAAQNALAANASDSWVMLMVPAASVSDVTVGEAGGPVVFTVTLSYASPDTVLVPYSTADDTATVADGDYTATSGTLTFLPSETTKTVSVPVTNDMWDEPDETFVLNLGEPTNAVIGDGQGVATIADDDPTPALSIGGVTLAEGTGGTTALAFTVTLSAVSGRSVTVGYATADGTATAADGDYTLASGTLTFAPGETTKTVTVQVTGDARNETDETFAVNLSGATNATIGTATGTGTITDDDPLPTLSVNSVSHAEGASGGTAFVFTVTLSAVSGRTVSVSYATANGTATTADGDFVAAAGTLTFAPGETSKTVTVDATGDLRNEIDETFTVNLSGATNGTIGASSGTGTVLNDDPEPILSVDSVSAAEGGALAFTVSLSAVSGRTVTVNYATADGSATAGSDYAAASGTLTFAPGETSKTVTVSATSDNTFEPDETFTLTLSGAANAGGAAGTGTGTIANDDAIPAAALSTVAGPVAESGDSATVAVTLSNPSYLPVTVSFVLGGTATATDLVAPPASVTIPAGQLTANVVVVASTDTADEPDETVTLTIGGVVNGTAAGGPVVLTIADDDLPVAAPAGFDLFEDVPFTTPASLLATANAQPGSVVELVGAAPAGGMLNLAPAGTFTFAPAANANGTVGFSYRVRNPAGEVSAPAAVALRVAAVNDPPAFTPGPDQADPRRGGPQVVRGWATAISAGPPDEASQRLTFEVTTDNPGLFAVQPAIDPATGTLMYTPGTGFGTAVVTVLLRDDAGGADTSPARTFTISVLKYRDDNLPTNQDEVGRIGVGSGDSGIVAMFRGDGAAAGTLTPFTGASARVVTADVTGDGVADTITATGPGVRSRVVVIDGATGAVARTILPFEDTFTGGLFVSAADVDGDGKAEIAVSPDTGGGGRVTVFGAAGVVADFFGIDDRNFRGGARVTFGDVNGDGTPDLVVVAGFGGGPRTAIYDGVTLRGGPSRLVSDFFAFPGTDAVNLRNGVFVAAGDVDGDGFADLAFGGGPGGAPRVFVLSGALVSAGRVDAAHAAPVANFFVAGNTSDRGGVRLAVKDADGDDRADVVAGSGEGSAARVRVYAGSGFGGGGEPGGFFDLEPFGGSVLASGVYVG